mmetsp:Transcript_36546/g.71315  ORF Transcript_36546/g.71315 Transcript_36546/m.71315 type:complete len:109 (-) Transcript_36546:565-891(-)
MAVEELFPPNKLIGEPGSRVDAGVVGVRGDECPPMELGRGDSLLVRNSANGEEVRGFSAVCSEGFDAEDWLRRMGLEAADAARRSTVPTIHFRGLEAASASSYDLRGT